MSNGAETRTRFVLCALLLVLMLACAMGITAYIKVFHLHLQKTPIYPPGNRQVASIPDVTPGWKAVGTDEILGAEITEVLGTENYLTRHYLRTRDEDPNNPIVLAFHAAYYTGMIDTVPHVPERCFVGGGLIQSESSRVLDLPVDTSSWRLDESVPKQFAGLSGKLYTVRLSNDPKMSDAPGSRIRLPRDIGPDSPLQMRVSEFVGPEGNIYAGYFFIANGGTKASANQVRQLAFNLEDDYAYYMKVQVSTTSVDSFEEFTRYSGELVGELIGEIMRCVPDWVEVQEGRYPPDNPRAADRSPREKD